MTIAAASEWFGGGIPTDAWVSKNSPSTNNAAAGWLRAGTTSTSADVARVYLKFNTEAPELEGATVVDADLWVWNYKSGGPNNVNCGDPMDGSGIGARRITSSWDTSTLSWSRQPTLGNVEGESGNKAGYNYEAVPPSPSWCTKEEHLVHRITNMARAWIERNEPNHGVVLQAVSESATINWRQYYSSEYGGDPYPGYRHPPTLMIEYTPAPRYVEEYTLVSGSPINLESLTDEQAAAMVTQVSTVKPDVPATTTEEAAAVRTSAESPFEILPEGSLPLDEETWDEEDPTPDQPPKVQEQIPGAGATDVSPGTPVVVLFNERVADTQISVKNPSGTAVAGTLSANPEATLATFTPAQRLAANTVHTVEVTGATDIAGNTMSPYSWTFTTGEADTTAPSVVSTDPADQAANAPATTRVTATFNERVSNARLALTDAAGTLVPGGVTMDAVSRSVTLAPTAPLTVGAVYTARVSGAKDTSDNQMQAPHTWSFTVGAEPDPTPITITLPLQADTWIDNQGSIGPKGPTLWSGAYGVTEPRTIERTYLKFDSSALAGKTVKDARLELWNSEGDSYGCGGAGSGIKVQRITSAWDATTLRWSNQPAATSAGETTATDPADCDEEAPPSNAAWTWSVTNIVQAWASNQSDHGLVLRGADESANAPPYDRGFDAAESESLEPHPPVLKVTYLDDAGPGPTPTPTPDPDRTPPTVLQVEPADGAEDVASDAQVKITFSEPVADASFVLEDIFEGTQVPGNVTMNADKTVLTFTPGEPLDLWYRASIEGAKDNAGNAMAAPYEWWFGTGPFLASSQKAASPAATAGARGTGPSVSKAWTRSLTTDAASAITPTTTPQFMVKVSDTHKRPATVEVEIEHDPQVRSQGTGLIWSGTAKTSSSSVEIIQVPSGKLTRGLKVRWRARAETGEWTAWNQLAIASAAAPGPAKTSASAHVVLGGNQTMLAPGDFPYDPIDFAECWKNANRASQPGGFTKNSFNWCGSWYMGQNREAGPKGKVIEVKATTGFVGWRFSYAIRTAVGNKVSDRKGMTEAQKAAARATAEIGARNIEVWVIIDQVTPNRNWPDSAAMYENSKLAVGFDVKSDPGGACKPLPGHDNSTVSRTFQNWNNYQHHFRFTSDKLASAGAKRVATCTLIPSLYYDGALTKEDDEYIYNKPHEVGAIKKAVRCDTSELILMYYGGCIFDEITPTLGLSTADKLRYKGRDITNKAKDHAIHIREAMTSGKKIPGSPDRIIQNPLSPTPLTRAWPGNHAGDVEYENRQDVKAECETRFGKGWFEATGKHCDEYPFASTLEGAANNFFDFSVKLISVCANCAAGSTQSIFWQRYRVLPGDTFYVKIHDGQQPAQ
ncbi:Ig-like domain-containing protein [Nonomuraea sp. NPDC050680]|uniref:Ig-like domain-containing protein n=1 Tax=Nonomuraea sp. NPDC050680 TaxID=3154630 RepID=UPI0033DD3FA5